MPENLAELAGNQHLMHLVFEAVNTFYWSTRSSRSTTTVVTPAANPRVLLTVLTYSYAAGIYASGRVTAACAQDQSLRYLAVNLQIDAGQIRLFRGQNREVLRRCLSWVIRRTREMVAHGANASTNGNLAATIAPQRSAAHSMVMSQSEAERRLHAAFAADKCAGNEARQVEDGNARFSPPSLTLV